MTFTLDYNTPVGKIRSYIGDTNELEHDFEDEELQMFYNERYEELPYAILDALTTLAVKYNRYSGDEYRIDTLEYNEGKSKVSNFNSLIDKLTAQIENGTAPGQSVSAHTYGIYTDEYNENVQRMIDGEIIPPRTFDLECNQIRTKMQDGPYYNGG